jgi:hypothetical protein
MGGLGSPFHVGLGWTALVGGLSTWCLTPHASIAGQNPKGSHRYAIDNKAIFAAKGKPEMPVLPNRREVVWPDDCNHNAIFCQKLDHKDRPRRAP